jgi:hypothetical protein
MMTAYFEKWIPMLIKYYDVYDVSYINILSQLKFHLLFPLIISLTSLVFLKNYKTKTARMLPVLVFTFFAAVLIFFIQHKGWLYQLLPDLGIFSVILGILCGEALEWSGNVIKKIIYPLTYLTFLFFLFIPFSRPQTLSPMKKIISTYTKDNDKILVISTDIFNSYPLLLQMNRQPGSRYLTSFPIAFFQKNAETQENFPYKDWEHLSKEEKEFLNELLNDVNDFHPSLIFIHNSNGCQACPENFNIYVYLQKSGFINQIQKEYSLQKGIKNFTVFLKN